MLLSTDIDAAQIVSSSEETRFFDDIGCLAASWSARQADGVAFVRTSAGVWSDASGLWYARPAAVRTAMGSGFRAYATADAARAADRNGTAMTWDQVIASSGAAR